MAYEVFLDGQTSLGCRVKSISRITVNTKSKISDRQGLQGLLPISKNPKVTRAATKKAVELMASSRIRAAEL